MYLLKRNFILIFLFLYFFVAIFPVYSADKKLIIVGEEFAPFEFIQDGKIVGIDID